MEAAEIIERKRHFLDSPPSVLENALRSVHLMERQRTAPPQHEFVAIALRGRVEQTGRQVNEYVEVVSALRGARQAFDFQLSKDDAVSGFDHAVAFAIPFDVLVASPQHLHVPTTHSTEEESLDG